MNQAMQFTNICTHKLLVFAALINAQKTCLKAGSNDKQITCRIFPSHRCFYL